MEVVLSNQTLKLRFIGRLVCVCVILRKINECFLIRYG